MRAGPRAYRRVSLHPALEPVSAVSLCSPGPVAKSMDLLEASLFNCMA